MARQRLIKPDFFQHEELYRAEMVSALPCRLAFAGLWTQCDRRGLFEWKPVKLKLNILPFDPVDFGDVLDALEREGFVWSYVVDGKRYGCIPSFAKHQTFNINEKADKRIPAPPEIRPEPVPAPYRDGAGTDTARCSTGASTPGTGTGTGTGTAAGTGFTPGRASTAAAAADRAGPEQSESLALTVAANQAIAARFGEQPSPIIATHGSSHDLATTLREAGIPVAFGARVIADVVARAQFKRPPRSLGYFRAAIVEAWEAEQAHAQARSTSPVTPNGEPPRASALPVVPPMEREYPPFVLGQRAQHFTTLAFVDDWDTKSSAERERDYAVFPQRVLGGVSAEQFAAEWAVVRPLFTPALREHRTRHDVKLLILDALREAVAAGTLGGSAPLAEAS